MALSLIECFLCGRWHEKENGHINRSMRIGAPVFCSKLCKSQIRNLQSKRCRKSKQQLMVEKRQYDVTYRQKNKEKIATRKKKYHLKSYNKEKEALKRKTDKYRAKHRKYLSTDKYKAWKHKYDRKYRCKNEYREFWEAASLLIDIDNKLKPKRYEIDLKLNRFNKAKQRRRNYEKTKRCELERLTMGNFK